MDRTPRPNEIYQHFKGNLYRVITLAKHADTGEILVIYQALYGSFEVFARPLSEFTGKVDRTKYPDTAAEYRFTLLPQIVGQASGTVWPEMRGQALDNVQQQGSGTENAGTQNRRQPEPDGIPARQQTAPAQGQTEPAQRRTAPAQRRTAPAQQQAAPAEDAEIERHDILPQDVQPDEEEEPALDPMLLAFLDADTYEEKLAIFTDMSGRVTDDMLTTMAVSMDIDLKEGELMDRYEELKNCIIMREKYECNRLR